MRKEYVLTKYEYYKIITILDSDISNLFRIRRDEVVEKTLNDLCEIRKMLYDN